MYQFSTIQGDRLFTFLNPEDIVKCSSFDCYDDEGNLKSIERDIVKMESFKFDKCFIE